MRALVAVAKSRAAGTLEAILHGLGATVERARSRGELRRSVSEHEFDFLVVDRHLFGADLADDVREIRALPTHPAVVVVGAGLTSVEQAHLAAAGTMAVLDVDLPADLLAETLEALVERRRRELARRFRPPGVDVAPQLSDFASDSPVMRRLVDTARRVAQTDSVLLVLGETGVGKEWLSRGIHAESPRARGPFIAVNCGALPDTLLESELFGHEKGAFTGAVRSHRGYFELAHRGTLFLDEIGEMPPHLQVRLLRVLEERMVWPVGGEKGIAVDLRIIAATNRSPEEEIATGRLRKDLYYRLGVLSLTVPPLRERREDIPVLASSYLDRFARKFGRSMDGLDQPVLDALCAYEWPGNVRELINVIERAVLLASSGAIGLEDLPDNIRQPSPRRGPGRQVSTPPAGGPSWDTMLAAPDLPPLAALRREVQDSFERAYLAEALRRSGGRVGEAASRAGLDPRTLFEKMRKLGLRKESFKLPARRKASRAG